MLGEEGASSLLSFLSQPITPPPGKGQMLRPQPQMAAIPSKAGDLKPWRAGICFNPKGRRAVAIAAAHLACCPTQAEAVEQGGHLADLADQSTAAPWDCPQLLACCCGWDPHTDALKKSIGVGQVQQQAKRVFFSQEWHRISSLGQFIIRYLHLTVFFLLDFYSFVSSFFKCEK